MNEFLLDYLPAIAKAGAVLALVLLFAFLSSSDINLRGRLYVSSAWIIAIIGLGVFTAIAPSPQYAEVSITYCDKHGGPKANITGFLGSTDQILCADGVAEAYKGATRQVLIKHADGTPVAQ